MKLHFPVLHVWIGLFLLSGCREKMPEDLVKVAAQLPQTIDFNAHIKPILSDRCFKCHGPDAHQRKAKLRLDLEANALGRGESGKRAIVPGNLRKSELFQRIISRDLAYQMPTPESKLKLSNYEKALIAKWIEQGAEWKPHWSFIPPQKTAFPSVSRQEWIQQDLDYFILSKLEKEQLSPAPKADKATLLRRLSLDLTGLPPGLAELDAYEKDNTKAAFNKIVERLLASPHFGERMAADWMDVARYADTHGYLDDTHREAWYWRDWVIKAYNDNLPYDQFITWQTAGDLLPNATKEQRLATGFQRMHRQNQEGGVLPEEYRVEYVADRVATTSKAFLGLTMECARCHDHKYDPVSQKEFYQMAAFFNSTNELGRAPIGYESGPTMLVTDEELDKQIAFIQEKIKQAEYKLAVEKKSAIQAFQEHSTAVSKDKIAQSLNHQLIAHFTFDQLINGAYENRLGKKYKGIVSNWQPGSVVNGRSGKAIRFDDKNSVVFGKDLAHFDRTDAFSFSTWIWLPTLYEDASVLDNCDHKWHAYRGYEIRIHQGKLQVRLSHNYPQNALVLESTDNLPAAQWIQVGFSYDGSSQPDGLRLFANGRQLPVRVISQHLYKSILQDKNNEMVVMPYLGLKVGWRMNDPTLLAGKMDDLKIWSRALSALEMAYLGGNWSAELLQKKELVNEWFWVNSNHSLPDYQALKSIQKEENDLLTPISETMVLGDQKTMRPTHVLNRGIYSDIGEQVDHGMPEKVFAFEENLPKNRLGLSAWLTDPKNPLTARVAVNRIWQLLFGKGLVATPDDFGNQGSLPSHPELLDWLAVDFIESGWDVKALIRKIVLSATYQQSSNATEIQLKADPDNQWFSRGPRYRLSAEMIRDQALAVSGLLNPQIGGKSFKPYQPEGLWAEQAFQAWANYVPDTDKNLYRRTMYIYWKRNTPHPYLTTFDIPDRATCSVKRVTTSTPTQALLLLNYPQFLEAARALAERTIMEIKADEADRLVAVFRCLTTKYPTAREARLIKQLYREEKEKFQNNREAAHAYLSEGLYPINQKVDISELAALTVVAHSIMNTVGFYMKK